MAEFRIEALQEISHDGHNIQYGVKFRNFGNTLPRPYERWFSYHCPVSYTSFMFRVTFQRAPHEGGVDCIVLIKRTDDVPIRVDGDFFMSAFTEICGVSVPPRRIRLDGMPRFSQTTRIVEAFVPNDILTQLRGKYILFEANLGIHGCHRERDTEASSRRPGPRPVPEKLKFLAKM